MSGVSNPATTGGASKQASKQAALELHNMHDIGASVSGLQKSCAHRKQPQPNNLFSGRKKSQEVVIILYCLLS